MVQETAAAATAISAQQIAARIERLPVSRWHTKMRLIIGTAWFFDGFDALTIAFVLPALIPMWKLGPEQIGLLIAAGYAGQAIGSVAAGWAAERYGRTRVMLWMLVIFTLGSFSCAAAWSLGSMMVLRFIQGLGLGGEIPIMHAYVNEFARAQGRGRFSLSYQVLFPVGIVATGLVARWVVPNFGWQWMFIIGGVPALLAIPARLLLIESPRWLASRGRMSEADAAMSRIEAIVSDNGRVPLPPLPANLPLVQTATSRFGDLFKGIYRQRTLSLWGLWICSYICIYGITAWFPTIARTVYKLSVPESLNYGLIVAFVNMLGTLVCVGLVDVTGRKPLYTVSFVLSALPLLYLWFAGTSDPQTVLWLASMSAFALGVLALGMGMFTAENYPNHMRALGGGIANAWLRAASMVTPALIGYMLPRAGINAVWLLFGVSALLGAVICALFSIETRGRVLEELSPAP